MPRRPSQQKSDAATTETYVNVLTGNPLVTFDRATGLAWFYLRSERGRLFAYRLTTDRPSAECAKCRTGMLCWQLVVRSSGGAEHAIHDQWRELS